MTRPAWADGGRGEIAGALALSVVLHAALMLAAVVWRSQPVHVFEFGSVPIKVSILEGGPEVAGPGERGPMLIEGAPPAAAPSVAVIAEPEPAPPAPVVEEAPPPPRPKPDATRIAGEKPVAKPAASTPAAPVDPAPTQPTTAAPGSALATAPPPAGTIAGEGGTGRQGGSAMAPAWAPTARASYRDRIKAWIDRYKVYPAMARRRHLEGEGRMSIRIDRGGRVLARTIERSTGERMLDLAALETVDRASPFPAVPAEYPDETFSFTYPFEFRLR